jgi:hypothetical protein
MHRLGFGRGGNGLRACRRRDGPEGSAILVFGKQAKGGVSSHHRIPESVMSGMRGGARWFLPERLILIGERVVIGRVGWLESEFDGRVPTTAAFPAVNAGEGAGEEDIKAHPEQAAPEKGLSGSMFPAGLGQEEVATAEQAAKGGGLEKGGAGDENGAAVEDEGDREQIGEGDQGHGGEGEGEPEEQYPECGQESGPAKSRKLRVDKAHDAINIINTIINVNLYL